MNLSDLKAAIQLAEEQGATDSTKVHVNGVIEVNYDNVVADTDKVESDYIPAFVYNGQLGGDSFWIQFRAKNDDEIGQSHGIQKVSLILGQQNG